MTPQLLNAWSQSVPQPSPWQTVGITVDVVVKSFVMIARNNLLKDLECATNALMIIGHCLL